ncbi:MAG TPA: MBL fold metallo-hydrolase RNA specificity domain-containing protein, partial [Rhodoglobus sp.]|nr:MBL fold metallo-hydrolase RNA specificity domain-containing protein [Rhodoglobus sp.]
AGRIPEVPVYLNSPMAKDATSLYRSHREENRISDGDFEDMYNLATIVTSVDDSKLLNLRGGPMIIISASGMLTGGRVLHHVVAYGDDPANAIVLSGFQAGGTRGAALAAGADHLRIFGKDVPIRAEVVQLQTMSAHADADGVLAWLGAVPTPPEMIYVTHGEPASADTLRARIRHELGWNARVPEQSETVQI